MSRRTPIPFPPGILPHEARRPGSLLVREVDWFQIRGIAPHSHVWAKSSWWEDRLKNLDRCTFPGCGLTREAERLDDSKRGE
jgi:hypothetical protein